MCVVILSELHHQVIQMPFSEDDELLQTLMFQREDDTLTASIQVW